MPDFSYFITRSAELVGISDGICHQFQPQVAWLENYHCFWLAVGLDFMHQFQQIADKF